MSIRGKPLFHHKIETVSTIASFLISKLRKIQWAAVGGLQNHIYYGSNTHCSISCCGADTNHPMDDLEAHET